MNLNKAFILGNLAADPEFRTTQSGQEVATIRVATNRVWTDQGGQKQEAAEFHRVVLWGRLAQIANQYLSKGRLVMIEGRIQTRSYEGKDGIKRYQTEIVAENLQLGPRFQGEKSTDAASFGPNQSRQSNQSPSANPTSSWQANSRLHQDYGGQAGQTKTQIPTEAIPVINEDEPPNSEEDIEETEVKLSEVPF